MDVGLMMIFASYGWEGMADRQVCDEDIRLVRQAPSPGFDVLCSAELTHRKRRSRVWAASPQRSRTS